MEDWKGLDFFGEEANVGLTACILMGLTPSEGSALFEVRVSPSAEAGLDEMAFCHGLTPALAAKGLRSVADGVFSSFMWDDVQYHVGLDEWLNEVLGGHGADPEDPLSGLNG